MRLEDYFELETFPSKFGPGQRIRLKGHRISIEQVLEHYKTGAAPEVIQREHYPSLTLEQVYATITYYLHKQAEVEEYLRRGEEIADAYYQDHLRKQPDAVTERLRELVARRDAGGEARP